MRTLQARRRRRGVQVLVLLVVIKRKRVVGLVYVFEVFSART